jgi:hypothetical protein
VFFGCTPGVEGFAVTCFGGSGCFCFAAVGSVGFDRSMRMTLATASAVVPNPCPKHLKIALVEACGLGERGVPKPHR